VKRRAGVAAAIVVVIVVGVAVALGRSRHGAPASAAAPEIATAAVRRTNLAATELVNATLGFAPSPPVIIRRSGTFTWLPPEGGIVNAGDAVATVDSRPVILLAGSVAAWRAFTPGMTDGDDVAQLEQGLVSLGFAPRLTPDRHFNATTAAAIRRWQAHLGEPVTGVVNDGDVVFVPAPIRVGTAVATVGGPAQPGTAPYAATSTTRVVQTNLDAARQQGVTAGTAVTVDLPGGVRAAGHIASVGTVATTATAPDGSGTGRPTVPLTVSLDDPGSGGSLDQEPVQIELVTDSRTGVLAVPITALLALAEGGYGVEVVPPTGPHRIEAVTPGLFASGLVEITSSGLTEGTVVVVAK
jgi:peptidoglycan hydrolase-like protein with peptidoglycan-binding domain